MTMTPEERAEKALKPLLDVLTLPVQVSELNQRAIATIEKIAAAIREAVEAERERCVLTMRSFTNVAMDKADEAIRSPEEE